MTSPVAAAPPIRRSLVCTRCGYELRGHGAAARCPECGLPVRDSRAAGRAGWTPAIGIRRALLHMLVWTPVVAACLFGLLWLLRTPFAWFAGNVAGFRYVPLLCLAGVPFAAIFVWLIWRRLQQAAGFTGWQLAALALVGVWTAIWLGTWAAVHPGGVAVAPASAFSIGIAAFATGWVVHSAAVDS